MHEKSKIWIDVLASTVYEYNCSYHRAIKTSPFAKYRNRRGFNDAVHEDASENELDRSDSESTNGPYTISIENPAESSEDENTDIVLESTQETSKEIEDRKSYELSMEKAQSVHLRRLNILQGSEVLLRRDFDQNPSTRKRKFIDFYEDGVFKVLRVLPNNMLEIRRNSEQPMTVYMGRVKKIKK